MGSALFSFTSTVCTVPPAPQRGPAAADILVVAQALGVAVTLGPDGRIHVPQPLRPEDVPALPSPAELDEQYVDSHLGVSGWGSVRTPSRRTDQGGRDAKKGAAQSPCLVCRLFSCVDCDVLG